MKFSSTRGGSDALSPMSAILKGIASDGGLFVPNELPEVGYKDFIKNKSKFQDISANILNAFFDDYTSEEITNIVNKAYATFDCDDVVPIKAVGDDYVIELFHGETLAFKDVALSVLPRLMSLALKKKEPNKNIFILTATSGDTGSAALYGFKNIDNIKICVFYPKLGISEIQKKQMTAVDADNVFVCGINGNFDNAQSGVKSIFENIDKDFLNQKNIILSSANSINIGRLVPQIAYYFYAYAKLVKDAKIVDGEQINFCVPTGNFGNILAGFFAKLLGLPIKKLICASNENNVLTEFLQTGIYDKNRELKHTLSPSMDILIASNLERLLYLISGDTAFVSKCMKDLKQSGKYDIGKEKLEKIKQSFSCGYADDNDTKKTIKEVFEKFNYLIDPHTAVGYKCIQDYKLETGDKTKCVLLSTASPFKFADACLNSLGIDTGECNCADKIEKIADVSKVEISYQLNNVLSGKERFKDLIKPNEMMEYVLKCMDE
ncbi:MAG: threonine synthase [Rickettsiales bacterium]|nr:threonine synthase [Rickettsiales bacterium]